MKHAKFDVEGWVAAAYREFQGPRVTLRVDDGVDVDVTAVAKTCELLLQREEHLLRKLAALDIAHDRPGLAAIRADITAEELLKFVILFNAIVGESGRPEPGADGELDAIDRLLQ